MKASNATFADREEQLHVLVEVVLVAARHVLREPQPVARLPGRARAVAHELDDRFLLEGEVAR